MKRTHSGMAIAKCLADPAFMGRTVRHGGVGGERLPSEGFN